MEENFTLVDLKTIYLNNDDKTLFYAVVYSDSEYLFKVFCSEKMYKQLKSLAKLTDFNVKKYIKKTYNEKSGKFRYFFINE